MITLNCFVVDFMYDSPRKILKKDFLQKSKNRQNWKNGMRFHGTN